MTIQAKNGQARITDEKTGEKTTEKTSDPLHLIQEALKPKAVHNREFRLVGGAVGYISYDAVRYWEKLPQPKGDIDCPDVEMGIYDDGFIFDHTQQLALYYYQEENRLAEVEKLLQKPADEFLSPK